MVTTDTVAPPASPLFNESSLVCGPDLFPWWPSRRTTEKMKWMTPRVLWGFLMMIGSRSGQGTLSATKLKPRHGLTTWPIRQASKLQNLWNPELALKALLSARVMLTPSTRGPSCPGMIQNELQGKAFLCLLLLPQLTLFQHRPLPPDHSITGPTKKPGCQQGMEAVLSRSWDVGGSFAHSHRGLLCVPISAWRVPMYSILTSPRCWARNAEYFFLSSCPWIKDTVWTFEPEYGFFWIIFLGVLLWLHSHRPLSHTTCPVLSKRPFAIHMPSSYGYAVCHSCLWKSHHIYWVISLDFCPGPDMLPSSCSTQTGLSNNV